MYVEGNQFSGEKPIDQSPHHVGVGMPDGREPVETLDETQKGKGVLSVHTRARLTQARQPCTS